MIHIYEDEINVFVLYRFHGLHNNNTAVLKLDNAILTLPFAADSIRCHIVIGMSCPSISFRFIKFRLHTCINIFLYFYCDFLLHLLSWIFYLNLYRFLYTLHMLDIMRMPI